MCSAERSGHPNQIYNNDRQTPDLVKKSRGHIIGINFKDADSSEKPTAAYDQFCKRSDEDSAYSRTFYNTFRSSDGAVSAWEKCVIHAKDISVYLARRRI
jgi:hypothetical protein